MDSTVFNQAREEATVVPDGSRVNIFNYFNLRIKIILIS
jgi:hypothetical protein